MQIKLDTEEEQKLTTLARQQGTSVQLLVSEAASLTVQLVLAFGSVAGFRSAVAPMLHKPQNKSPTAGTPRHAGELAEATTPALTDAPDDLDTLIAEQGVRPVTNIDELASDLWPKDEDPDEFLRQLREWRNED